jgi:hypothetical protein
MRYETGHLNKAPNEKQLGRGKKKKKENGISPEAFKNKTRESECI